MADYPISNVARRIVYTGSAGVGPYAFPFEVLTNTDINVYKNDTLLTLTTNYTVTISPTLGTGSITLVVAATGTDRITIIGARAIQRTTDFTTGGDFFANTLNDEMDSQTILVQQVAETAERSIRAPVTDPTSINMTLPKNTDRAGKYLSFNASTGNPETTSSVADVTAVAANIANVNTVATNIASVNTAATNIAAIIAAPTQATNAANSATAAQSAQTAAESARDATLAAYDSFDDRYLGAKTSDPALDNDGNALLAGALYFNSVSGIMKLYTGSAWVASYVSGDGFVPQTSITGSADIPNGTTGQRDASPLVGFFRFNTTLGKFEGYNGTVWGAVGGGATGGGADAVFIENDKVVTANYTIPVTKNALSTGTITINSGVTVTVPTTSRWVVL